MKPKIFVHVCCAPDALYVLNLLEKEYEVKGYFYNPNIHPKGEYDLRLQEARKVARFLNVPLIEGEYDPERWFGMTRKFSSEPEKGRRCDICFALRLENTAALAAERNIDVFTTVMSLSPWKKAEVLNRIGRMWAARNKISYLEANFKKKDGFRKSVFMSDSFGLYRQNYCGCEYSRR
jgi:predicted adenine nucleotide alpha hydrolase (AANH) superfamily ATPase